MNARDPERVNVERVFPAVRERVFDAWTQPALIKRWNTRPGVTVPLAEVDLRAGGKYRLHLRGPDGVIHRIVGVYQVVERPTRLVYTWQAEDEPTRHPSVVTVDFSDCADGTRLTLRHERLDPPAARPRHAAGWEACLIQLQNILTTEKSNR